MPHLAWAKPCARMPHLRFLRNAWRTTAWACGGHLDPQTGNHWSSLANTTQPKPSLECSEMVWHNSVRLGWREVARNGSEWLGVARVVVFRFEGCSHVYSANTQCFATPGLLCPAESPNSFPSGLLIYACSKAPYFLAGGKSVQDPCATSAAMPMDSPSVGWG